MRYIILALLIAVPQLLLPQNKLPHGLIQQPLDWSQWEVPMTKEEKLKIVESLSKIVQVEYSLKYYNYTVSNILHMYHIVDFNKDGRPDVIYNGFTGTSNNGIIFFENRGETYEKTITLYGDIIEIFQTDVWAPLCFKTLTHRNCGNYVNFVELYMPVQENNINIEYQMAVKIGYVTGISFPYYFDANIPFKVIKEEVNLKAAPTPDDNTYKFAYTDKPVVDSVPQQKYFTYTGNVVAKFDTTATGFILDKEVIGGDWWYLVMIAPEGAKQSVFCGVSDNNSYKYYMLGWLHEKDVKLEE